MKHFLISALCLCTPILVQAQLHSPYVEAGTLIVNNSGFKAASIRTTTLSRPTPLHLDSDPINKSFPARFVVAKNDVSGTGTWAWANGWNTLANVQILGITVSLIPTGCASYFELGSIAAVGKWRLPTQREMALILLERHELSSQNISGFNPLGTNTVYWVASQYDQTQAWTTTANNIRVSVRPKSSNYAARCIRDLE